MIDFAVRWYGSELKTGNALWLGDGVIGEATEEENSLQLQHEKWIRFPVRTSALSGEACTKPDISFLPGSGVLARANRRKKGRLVVEGVKNNNYTRCRSAVSWSRG